MKKPKCKSLSVIIPCYNEEANIAECIRRVPKMPWATEIIAVNDGGKDGTADAVKKVMNSIPNVKLVSYDQNRGKGHAFRKGLEKSSGDVVIILDADMTSPPESIPDIVKPIFEGKADFVNGSRFVYPMEKGSMRWLHIPGNKMFALLASLIIRQRISDSLCGFKAFRREMLLGKLKEDSWPDFELLTKARKNKMRILEIPTHYKARTSGVSKMKTFKHGYQMFKMLWKSVTTKD